VKYIGKSPSNQRGVSSFKLIFAMEEKVESEKRKLYGRFIFAFFPMVVRMARKSLFLVLRSEFFVRGLLRAQTTRPDWRDPRSYDLEPPANNITEVKGSVLSPLHCYQNREGGSQR